LIELILDRIRTLIDTFADGKAKHFSELVGVKQSTLATYLSKGSEPSLDSIIKISIKTNVNLNWLVLGEGSMYRGEVPAESQNKDMDIKRMSERLISAQDKLINSQEALLEERAVRLREKNDYIELVRHNIGGVGKTGS